MRVTFDSNAWEKMFDPVDIDCASIRAALVNRKIEGFISEAAFRIEAITKRQRTTYFAHPHFGLWFHGIVMRDGQAQIHLSFGPDDKCHPGLPTVQANKLRSVLDSGIRLMRAAAWMGLPAPQEIRDPMIFVQESEDATREREQRQIDAFALLNAHGVGRAAFDAVGGWNAPTAGAQNEKKFRKACAEWADGELVAAHIAYQNDILCTDDFARTAGISVFDPANRAWLTSTCGVQFLTLVELANRLAA